VSSLWNEGSIFSPEQKLAKLKSWPTSGLEDLKIIKAIQDPKHALMGSISAATVHEPVEECGGE